MQFKASEIRKHAEAFDKEKFKKFLREFIENKLEK
jgi:hypothetical protein